MSLFFNSAYNKDLLTLANFKAAYNLNVTVESLLHGNSVPVAYSLQFTYLVEQLIAGKELLNTITLKEVISPDGAAAVAGVQELITLSKIAPVYKTARNLHGEITEMRNAKELLTGWQKAKLEIIPGLYKNAYERRAFILGYENGLRYTDKALSNNWQYLLMLPEVYNFNHYTGPYHLSTTKTKSYKSGFLLGVAIDYRMCGVSITVKNGIISLKLLSEIINKRQLAVMEKEKIKEIPGSHSFEAEALYTIEKHTGKVLSASATLTEKMEDASFYRLEMALVSTDNLAPEKDEIKEIPKRTWSVFDGIDDPHQ